MEAKNGIRISVVWNFSSFVLLCYAIFLPLSSCLSSSMCATATCKGTLTNYVCYAFEHSFVMAENSQTTKLCGPSGDFYPWADISFTPGHTLKDILSGVWALCMLVFLLTVGWCCGNFEREKNHVLMCTNVTNFTVTQMQLNKNLICLNRLHLPGTKSIQGFWLYLWLFVRELAICTCGAK